MLVVIFGSIHTGITTVYGPFPDNDAAESFLQYANDHWQLGDVSGLVYDLSSLLLPNTL